uniref:UDP-N-acetylglucosamine--dolichyl-phosphate N-acetylglucosaminephosphotransferase n=1 Tax=Meloidogyne enterolobii TaxID=390850 RepID=A0A6V7TRS5_MELEN|nr:unnamed protein product [Meloidogyne enterolobii]
MASSSDIVDIDTENHDPDLTPKVIANKLNLGSKFEEWLTKQNGDPLLVLDFVGGVCLNLDNRALIRNALVANGAEETDFGNIFKFHDSTQLRNAKRGVKYAVPWAFYNSSPMVEGYQGPNREWIAYTRTPTILSAFVTSFSDKTGVLTQLYFDEFTGWFGKLSFYVTIFAYFYSTKTLWFRSINLDKKPVPEPIGVIAAAIYLIFLFTFIPLPFYDLINQRAIFTGEDGSTNIECDNSSFLNLLSFLAGLVSICTAVLLGFADDILDLRWRHKLLFPTLSSMPLLLVYLLSKNSTAVLLPHFLQKYLGGASFLDIGPFYYIFMVSLVIFCTNAINIIAGINGVEVGQSLVIRSIDSIQLWHHVLSLCFILPFIGTSPALFIINKYPAKAFVGDTYCYWAGMTIVVSALTGRFSKTLLLFLLPQIINFIFSCPQLFHFIPCPRHRLPRLNENGKLEMSMVDFQPYKLSKIGNLCFRILGMARLIYYKEYIKDGESWVSMNNLTILNLLLKFNGPQFEWELTNKFIILQILCSIFAFFCRFCLARIFYDEVN